MLFPTIRASQREPAARAGSGLILAGSGDARRRAHETTCEKLLLLARTIPGTHTLALGGVADAVAAAPLDASKHRAGQGIPRWIELWPRRLG
jgi:hypothetical protein